MTIDEYLFPIFLLSVLINLTSALMFVSRVHWPVRADFFAKLSILLGIPALIMAIFGIANRLGILLWLMPLLYAVFSVVALLLDFVWKVEFRQPRRPEILIPFLLLYYGSLIGMWGMLWDLGVVPWAIAGVSYFAMLGSSFYTLRKGAG